MAMNRRSVGSIIQISLRFLEKVRLEPGRPAKAQSASGSEKGSDSDSTAPVSYPGDFLNTSTIRYAPAPDGQPDPGEVVWTWVPYEEDYSRGKDRPVLLIGKSGPYLLGLMLTTKDHDQDNRGDNDYVDVGTGSWDRQGRPSEAKLDRILQISPRDIRREGAVLERTRFDLVAAGLRNRHGWT